MASAIAQSEVPLKQMNNTLKQFAQTLKNTVKWELSSNIVHGLESAINGAVSYAKNLNTSLTNIRIVTGQSVEDMAKFAVEANKAARALSTTTKAYADASLIYYQQGDSVEQAAKKAEITLKAANSSFNTSAAEMSEYLTAVWNSYQVGAEELERYVDIMAALGAKTATSLEEIATSMQKVAATANTVGVSMEQVSSIVATVSSVTRESAESIGTSYKTIFARIGDLKLGEALDDGVTLGQVSSQLDKIGVAILDANGDMRDMGDIIEDLGSKWQTMSRAEQTAIAQVVAGKRQYTQLMALFENWDMYQSNINIAETSGGALQEMQDTYAESWKAASDQVTASLENIYNKIINDQAIIKFTKGISDAIDMVGGLIDAFGGIGGVLGNLGAIGVKVFEKQIMGSIDRTINKITTYFKQFEGVKDFGTKLWNRQTKNTKQLQWEEAAKETQSHLQNTKNVLDGQGQDTTAITYAQDLLAAKQRLIDIEHTLSSAEKNAASIAIANLSQQQQAVLKLKEEKQQLLLLSKQQSREDINSVVGATASKTFQGKGKKRQQINRTWAERTAEVTSDLQKGFSETNKVSPLKYITQADVSSLNSLYQKAESLSKKSSAIDNLLMNIDAGNRNIETLKQKVEALTGHKSNATTVDDLIKDLEKVQTEANEAQNEITDLVNNSFVSGNSAADTAKNQAAMQGLQNAQNRGMELGNLEYSLVFKESSIQAAKDKLKDLLNPKSEAYSKLANNITKASYAASSLTAGLSAGKNIIMTMSDESATLGDQLSSVAGGITSLMTGFATGGWIGLAASAIGMIISGITEAQKQAREAYEEDINTKAEESQTKIDAIKEENAAISELLPKYGELAGSITSSSQISSEYQTAVDDLTTALGFQGETIDGLIAKYHSLDQAIIEGTKTQIQESIDAYEQAKKDLVNKAAMDLAQNTEGIVQYGTSDSFYVDTSNLQSIINNQNTSQVYSNISAGGQFNYQGVMSSLITTYSGEFSDYLTNAMKESFDEAGNFDFNKFYELIFNQIKEFLEIDTDNFNDTEIDAYLNKANSLANFIQQFDSVFGDTETNLGSHYFGDNGLLMLTELFDFKNSHGGKSGGEFSESWLGQLASGGNLNNLTERDQSEYWSDYVNIDANSARETAIADSVEMSEEARATLAKMRSGVAMTSEELYQFYLELTTLTEEYPELANDTMYKALHDQFGTIFTGIQEPLEAAQTQLELIQNGMDITALKSANIDSVSALRDYINGVYTEITGLNAPAPASFMKSAADLLQLWGIIPEVTNTLVNELSISAGIAENADISQDTVLTAMDTIRQDSIWQEPTTTISYEDLNWNHLRFNKETKTFDRESLLAEIAYTGTQDRKSKAATSIAGIKTLQDYDLNEIEALGADGFEELGIEFDSSIAGFEGVTDVASWLKLSAEDRETYLTKLLEKQERAYYEENGILQQAIEADTARKTELETMYNEAIASQQYDDAKVAVATAEKQIAAGDKIISQRSKITDADIMTYLKELYGENFSEDLIQQYEIDAWRNAETDEEAKQTNFYQKVVSGQTLASEGVVQEQAYLDIVAGYNAEAVALGSQIEKDTAMKNWAGMIADAGSSVDVFGNSIKILTQDLNTLNNEFNALNSIDVNTIPKAGTQAYEALSASLEKAGKTMSDYRQMSEKDRIKTLGQAKKENLEAQRAKQKEIEDKYATKYSFNTSTTQADILATGDKDKIAAYEAWIASQEAQADLTDEIVQEAQNTADELIRVGAANTEAAIARFQQEQKKLKNAGDRMMDAANVLADHIDGSEMSFAEQAKLDPVVLEQWKQLTTEEQRAKFAAEQTAAAYKKQMEYQQNINDGITGASTFMKDFGFSDANLSNTVYGDKEKFENWLDLSGSLGEEAKAALMEAWEAVDGTLKDNATAKEWGDAIRAELSNMGDDGEAALAQIEAAGKDSLSNIFTDFSEKLRQEAQEAADAWLDIFNKIKDARKTLIEGGSLMENIAGDPETLLTYLESYRKTKGNENATAADLLNAIQNGSITEKDLNLDSATLWGSNVKQQYGFNLQSSFGTEFGTASIYDDKSAIAKMLGFESGYQSANAEQKQAIDEVLKQYYANMLKSTEGLTDQAALIKAQNIIDNNQYSEIKEARQELIDAIDAAASGLDTMANYDELKATRDKTIEDKEKEIKEFEQQLAEQSQYSDMAGKFFERKDEPIQSILGDDYSESEYLNIVNTALQAMGKNEVSSLDEIDRDTWGELQVHFEEQSQIFAREAVKAGEEIVTAGTTFAETVKGIFGENSSQYTEATEDLEDLNKEQEDRERVAGIDETETISYKQIQSDLDLSESRQNAISGILDASTMSEMESAAVSLREAYEGADATTQKWVEDLIKAREAGEDGIDANKKLTSQHIKGMKQITKMSKAQRDQYKQMLKNNKVTVDGYKNLDEYFSAIDSGCKIYDDMIKATKELSEKGLGKVGDSFGEGVKDIEGQVDNLGDVFEKILPDSFDGAADTIAMAFQNGGSWNDVIANGFDTATATFDAKTQTLLQQMGFSAEQILALQSQYAAAINENGSLGYVDFLSLAANMDVDPSQFDSVITALNDAMAQIQALLAENGIELDPPWNPVPTLGEKGIGRGGGGSGGGSNAPSGGGGGGGNQKEKKDYKRFKDENERYHVQNETLDRIGEQLDKIDKLKDAAYGSQHLAQLDAETKALKEQYEAQVDLYNEAMKYQAADRADLIGLNVGVQFDENGTISNYEEVIQKLVDRYNAAVEQYNNSEQEEGDKLRLEDAEEAYNDAIDSIENYEEAVATANEAQNEMLDILNQLSEIELEKITYELELNLEVNEKDIELLEYFQSKYEDTLHAQDELFGSLMESAAQYEDNLSAIDRAYRDLLGAYTSGTINEADYAEGLKELSDQMIENLNSLQDVADEIAETYTNTLELAREEVDKTAATLEHFNSVMESYINIAGLSGKTFFGSDGEEVINSYKGLDAFYDAQYKNNLNRILIHREHLNVLTEEEDRFRNKIEAGQQLTELEKQQYAALQEQIQETREQVLSATEETLETLQAGYENTINGIAQDLDEFMAGAAGSIAHLADQYAYFQEEQGRYVSTARELYEVSQLTRDIENSIADASTAASKEALKALQEKINKQSELNELTEYDIEMNQLQYQLLLARIQLEEAQNAKDTVRLTRDDNGNYAYQYTADQGKVDEAMQHYEDVLQQINDLTTQRTSEIEQQMIDAMQNYKDQFQEIALDQTLTAEQRNERLAELNNRFSETMLYLQEQNGIVTENLTLNQEAIAEHYGVSMSDITASTAGNVNETVQSMIDKTQEYINAMNQAIYGEDGANSAWKEYAERMGIVNNASGTAYEDMLNNTEELGEMNEYATEEALNTLQTLEETIKPLGDLTEAWDAHNEVLENTITYYEQLANNIHKVMSIIGETGTSGGIATGITSFMPNQSAINNYEEIIAAEQLNQALHGNDQKLEEMHQNELVSGGGGGNGKKKYAQSGFNYDTITDYVDTIKYQ